MIKTCLYCGQPFITEKGPKKYCSEECLKAQQKLNQKRRDKEYAMRKKERKTGRKAERLNDKIRSAREAGMSYGKYVAMQYIESQWKRD